MGAIRKWYRQQQTRTYHEKRAMAHARPRLNRFHMWTERHPKTTAGVITGLSLIPAAIHSAHAFREARADRDSAKYYLGRAVSRGEHMYGSHHSPGVTRAYSGLAKFYSKWSRRNRRIGIGLAVGGLVAGGLVAADTYSTLKHHRTLRETKAQVK